MKTIAITGGIGSGKSMVTEYLINKAYIVIDADKISREITASGGKAIPLIAARFGMEYITDDGSMDRTKMRELVFNDPKAKAILEECTTKLVVEEIDQRRRDALIKGVDYLFFDIPLLFEMKLESSYDIVWFIYCEREIRRERIRNRNNLDYNIIDSIIGSQLDDNYKASRSDYVIYNNGGIDKLYSAVDEAIANLETLHK